MGARERRRVKRQARVRTQSVARAWVYRILIDTLSELRGGGVSVLPCDEPSHGPEPWLSKPAPVESRLDWDEVLARLRRTAPDPGSTARSSREMVTHRSRKS